MSGIKAGDCIQLLRDKYAQLAQAGEGRYPKRSDFSAEEVTAIKAFLGPWPRALEKAGVKPEDPAGAEKRARLKAKNKARK